MVSVTEIEGHEYNLNIPRYIDNQEKEDIQDIEAHLKGGIPNADIADLENYWKVYPNLKKSLFEPLRSNYSQLKIEKDVINESIFKHKEFVAFSKEMDELFSGWKEESVDYLKALDKDCHPKTIIKELAENILDKYNAIQLIDKYNIYQHLLSYWNETMQDDCYIISFDGWKAETYRILVENKKKQMVDKGWTCDLIPKTLVIDRYYAAEKAAIEKLQAQQENIASNITELEEEHGGEDGYFAELEKINKGNAQKRVRELKKEKGVEDELKVMTNYVELHTQLSAAKKKIKEAEKKLDDLLYAKYPTLTEEEVKNPDSR